MITSSHEQVRKDHIQTILMNVALHAMNIKEQTDPEMRMRAIDKYVKQASKDITRAIEYFWETDDAVV